MENVNKLLFAFACLSKADGDRFLKSLNRYLFASIAERRLMLAHWRRNCAENAAQKTDE